MQSIYSFSSFDISLRKLRFILLVIIFICILFNSYACGAKWLRDVEMDGIKFKKIKTGDSGIIIGYLNENTTIQGYPCKKGWVHLYNITI